MHVRYSWLSILPDDHENIFAASLLISYFSFSYLTLLSVAIVTFHILSKRLHLKPRALSDARVVPMTIFIVRFL